MKNLNSILKIIDRISIFFGRFSALLVWGMMLVITYEVITRYFFNNPTSWGNQMIIFLFGTYGLMLGGYSLLKKAHVNVDILYARFSPRGRAILDIITSPWLFGFVIVMLWQGLRFGMTSVKYNEHVLGVWDPPLYWFKLIIPFGALLLLLQGSAKLVRDIYCVATNRTLPSLGDEDEEVINDKG